MATKKKTKEKDILERVLSDKRLRTTLVRERLEYFFPIYFHRYMQYETADFHKEIFSVLENTNIKLSVICAFRGSAKSTIITTAYVLWSILGVQQCKFIILCGQTEQKARQYLLNIKNELLHNDLLRKDLGPFEEEKNSLGNATAIIIKRLNVKIMISSVEQSIRGTRHGEHRPDLIILDDVEDINSVKTREGRNKTFDWFTGDIIPAGSRKTRTIVVGNLLHEDSLIKRLQRKIQSGEMIHTNPIYLEYPIIDRKNNPSWPGKYPTPAHIEAEKEKVMDDITWSREYLLKIISSIEQVVHREWITFYDDFPSGKIKRIAIGVDLAISEKESADYTAMVTGHIYGSGKDAKMYILPDPINDRITFPTQIDYIKSLFATQKKECNQVKMYIEDVGYQRAIIQNLEGMKYNVEGVSPKGSDKTSRLRLVTHLVRDGRILFPRKGCEELIMQLCGFGKESHDDLADAFAILVIKGMESDNSSSGMFGMFQKPEGRYEPVQTHGFFPDTNKFKMRRVDDRNSRPSWIN